MVLPIVVGIILSLCKQAYHHSSHSSTVLNNNVLCFGTDQALSCCLSIVSLCPFHQIFEVRQTFVVLLLQ